MQPDYGLGKLDPQHGLWACVEAALGGFAVGEQCAERRFLDALQLRDAGPQFGHFGVASQNLGSAAFQS